MATRKVWTEILGGKVKTDILQRASSHVTSHVFKQSYTTASLPGLGQSMQEVYGTLDGGLKEQFPYVKTMIEKKFLNAATRGVCSALEGKNPQIAAKHHPEELFEVVREGLALTGNNPIHLPKTSQGAYTGAGVSRALASNAYVIGVFTPALLSMAGGRKLTPQIIAEATKQAHHFSLSSPLYKEGIEEFNQTHKGHQAYDLQRIIEIQQEKEQNGEHQPCIGTIEEADIEEIFGSDGVLFTRWMSEVKGTEKDIAAAMFAKDEFHIPTTRDGTMRYFIGCWAGARATAIMLACRDEKGRFMGFDEAGTWAMARMAIADMYEAEYWMPADGQGKHTRNTLINAEAMTALFLEQEISSSKFGHLHRNQPYYWKDANEGRESFGQALQVVYDKSLEVKKKLESGVTQVDRLKKESSAVRML